MAKKPTNAALRGEVQRKNVSAEFFVIRRILVAAMAKAKVPTVEIADKLGVVRSFVIKQRTLKLKPTNPAERKIAKLATSDEFAPYFSRSGFKGLLAGEDVETVLAGGERPALGPLAERRAKAPKPAKAKAPKGQPGKPAKPAPKPVKAATKPKAVKAPINAAGSTAAVAKVVKAANPAPTTPLKRSRPAPAAPTTPEPAPPAPEATAQPSAMPFIGG